MNLNFPLVKIEYLIKIFLNLHSESDGIPIPVGMEDIPVYYLTEEKGSFPLLLQSYK